MICVNSVTLSSPASPDYPSLPLSQGAPLPAYPQDLHQLYTDVQETASSRGWEFSQALVYHVAIALNIRYALVTQVVNTAEQPSQIRVQVRAFWTGDGFGKPFSYVLSGAPCETVFATGSPQCFPNQVQARFPQDRDLERIGAQSYLAVPLPDAHDRLWGHLAILDTQPLTNCAQSLAALRPFAVLAIVENFSTAPSTTP